MHSITKSLFQKATSAGRAVPLQFQCQQFKHQELKSESVQIGNKKYYADLFVSNMDVVPFYKKLLSNEKQPKKIIKQERSSSALIFYWGIKRSLKT